MKVAILTTKMWFIHFYLLNISYTCDTKWFSDNWKGNKWWLSEAFHLKIELQWCIKYLNVYLATEVLCPRSFNTSDKFNVFLSSEYQNFGNLPLKDLGLQAFEESVDWTLLSSFCNDSDLQISVFKELVSTMTKDLNPSENFLREIDFTGFSYLWLFTGLPSIWDSNIKTTGKQNKIKKEQIAEANIFSHHILWYKQSASAMLCPERQPGASYCSSCLSLLSR